MKFDDLTATQKQTVQDVSKRLKEAHSYDFLKVLKDSRSLDEHIADTKRKLTIIENKSKFGAHLKNSSWKRHQLVLEGLMALKKKKTKSLVALVTEAAKVSKKLSENRKGMGKLLESELERSELVMASRNIVDEVQDMVEAISKIKIEKLASLVDRIKAEHGLETAESFNAEVGAQLDASLDILTVAKDSIDTQSHKLSGDVDPDAVADMGGTDELEDPMAPEMELGDEGGEDLAPELDLGLDDELAEPEAIERELKESKITVNLSTKAGKKGKKFFESRKSMRTWINENQNKIGKILKVTEAK